MKLALEKQLKLDLSWYTKIFCIKLHRQQLSLKYINPELLELNLSIPELMKLMLVPMKIQFRIMEIRSLKKERFMLMMKEHCGSVLPEQVLQYSIDLSIFRYTLHCIMMLKELLLTRLFMQVVLSYSKESITFRMV